MLLQKGQTSSAAKNKKKSYEKYLADILGVGSGDENEGFRFSPKKLFSLIKNSRQDNRGISTLKDSENILHSGNVKKANLLNSQVQSVFSRLSPLMLGQLCTKKIHNFFQENIPENIYNPPPPPPYVPLCWKSQLTLTVC